MNSFAYGSKNELLAFITSYANQWLDVRMSQHQYNQDKIAWETQQFLNLPLGTLCALVRDGLLTELPQEHPGFVSPVTVEGLIEGIGCTVAEAVEVAASHQPVIVEVISEKTNLLYWLEKKQQETKVSTRLTNILTGYTFGLRYVEDVTKEKFFNLRNAGHSAWAEFVKLRGW